MATKKAVDEIVARPYEIDFEYGQISEDGVLAYVVEWPDCFAAGRDRADALASLERTMRELAAYRLDNDLEIPDAAGGFSGKVLLRMPKKLHRDAERYATREGVSLNTWLTTAIARELGPAQTATPAAATKVRPARGPRKAVRRSA